MSPVYIPVLGLLALAAIIGLSLVDSRAQIGIVALAAAGALALAADFSAEALIDLFPTKLLLTLVGLTFLFGAAECNGTMQAVTSAALNAFGGRRAAVPSAMFGGAFAIAALGPGNIAAVALLAPPSLDVARRVGLSPFLASLLVIGGANAAALSPLALTGVIARELVDGFAGPAGIANVDAILWDAFLATAGLVTVLHGVGFLALGGRSWLRAGTPLPVPARAGERPRWTRRRSATAAGLAVFVVLVVVTSEVGLSAVALGAVLTVARLAPGDLVVSRMPWGTALLLCGMFTLAATIEKTGGIALVSQAFADQSGVALVALVALVAGALSSFSSSSTVVMPMMLPMVPTLMGTVGGGAQAALALIVAILVAAHLVDCSPLSSLGALCLAATNEGGLCRDDDRSRDLRRDTYRRLMIWGLSMIPFGAVACAVAFLVITRA